MSELSPNKQRLLEQRLGRRTPAKPRRPDPIPRRPPGPAPLSSGQSALLYEHRLRADTALYNVVFSYDIRGSFDIDRFENAVLDVVARHEPLRTACGPDRHELAVSESVEIVHISTDEHGFESASAREAVRRFDLEHGPLVRVTIASLAPARHGVILALHHISSDAASFSNLWREIDLSYHGDDLPPLATSYSSHAHWQQDRITQPDRDFWRTHLGSDAHGPDLALERPNAREGDGYLTVPIPLGHEELRRAGARPTPFFLGVFAALLQRYTDTDDVVVGVTASTRDHPDVDDLIGYFLTLLPLRLTIDPDATSAATTRAVDEHLAAALRHRHVPYSMIASDRRRQGWAEPDPARVMFVYDEPHRTLLRGAEVSGRIVHPEVSVTDLTLFVRPTADRFEVSVEWSGERYRESDVAALAREFARMAEWAALHPGSPWTGLPGPADLRGGAVTRELEPLPVLIERHVLKAPQAPALRSGDVTLSYAQLWDRSSSIAGGLREQGIGKGNRVAVMLERGVDAVASLLAVQRLGAAYVPIDPSYPAERIELILGEADVGIVVGETGAAIGEGAVVAIDDLTGHAPLADAVAAQPDDLAYIIFTSGSTGRPRGVGVDHRRLAASTLARLDWYADPVGTFVMPSSFGFDSSAAGVYWTLATGGELVIPTEREVRDIDALSELIERVDATHTLMVPSLYRAILNRAPDALRSLRCVIVAGEACSASLVDLHDDLLPDTTLFNEYGPTEATVWATAHRCVPGEALVPIGRPIPGASARIVDRWLRPRPTGAFGQLAIGGLGVTDGYVDRPDLTAEKFVTTQPGRERLYLSGDLARLDEHDQLHFLGRADHQVSVGGVRVEPEEIEAAILTITGVTASIVRVERQLEADPFDAIASIDPARAAQILREAAGADDPAGELLTQLADNAGSSEVLVAYVEGGDVDAESVRQALQSRLPRHLVPHTIELVDQLDRTEHGKVDRAALPPPIRRRSLQPSARSQGLVGVDDRVSLILRAFRSVLDRGDIDAEADFFESGGDSLRAVELVTQLEDELGQRIPISALVLGRTASALAAMTPEPTIDTTVASGARTSHVVPLRPGTGDRPLLIMPPGGGNLIAFDPLVQAMDERFPLLGFDLPGADRDEDLPVSVEDLCDTYLPQLRAAAPSGPYRLLGWSFGGVMALELAQRLAAEGEEIELVAMIDTLVPGYQRSGRHRIYLEFARNRDIGAIASRIRNRIRNRLRTRRVEQAGRDGGAPLTPQDREQWLMIKIDEIVERHRVSRYDGPVVFFAAQDSFTWRTVDPWAELLPDLEVVSLDGTHDGDEGLLTGERAERIAVELSNRLA